MTTSAPLLIALSPLVLWRIWARFCRQIGRQRSTALRHRIHVCLYAALLVLVAGLAYLHGQAAGYLLLGAAAGAALAQYGLRLTQFEPTRQGLFYTPKAWLGIGLSALFVGRIAHRFLAQWSNGGAGATPDSWMGAWTLALFGLLAGYNACYAFGLLRWRKQVIQAARARSATP